MPYKVVMFINGKSGLAPPVAQLTPGNTGHTYGFTEGFWYAQDSISGLTTYLRQTVAPARAGCLPDSSILVGARCYLEGTGQVQVIPIGAPGTGGLTDQANVALLCCTTTPTAYRQRRWWLHNVPDSMVQDGEFVPTVAYGQAVRQYFAALVPGATFRGLNPSNTVNILNISPQGLVTFKANCPFQQGNLVQVRNTLDLNHRRRGGQWVVSTFGPNNNQCTLSAWDLGSTYGGHAYTQAYILRNIATTQNMPFVERAGTRRVGRPSDLYRARKSAKVA